MYLLATYALFSENRSVHLACLLLGVFVLLVFNSLTSLYIPDIPRIHPINSWQRFSSIV
jgi:hypothetical protein